MHLTRHVSHSGRSISRVSERRAIWAASWRRLVTSVGAPAVGVEERSAAAVNVSTFGLLTTCGRARSALVSLALSRLARGLVLIVGSPAAVRRAFKHPRLMHYNRLIVLVALVNGALLARHLARGD